MSVMIIFRSVGLLNVSGIPESNFLDYNDGSIDNRYIVKTFDGALL